MKTSKIKQQMKQREFPQTKGANHPARWGYVMGKYSEVTGGGGTASIDGTRNGRSDGGRTLSG